MHLGRGQIYTPGPLWRSILHSWSLSQCRSIYPLSEGRFFKKLSSTTTVVQSTVTATHLYERYALGPFSEVGNRFCLTSGVFEIAAHVFCSYNTESAKY